MTRTIRSSGLTALGTGAACLLLAACSSAPALNSPSASASAASTASPSLSPSPSPTATPAPTASPTPVSSGVPAGFQPNSVTFVSLEMGWVLGSAPCPSGTCLSLLRTDDAGRSWSPVKAPPALFSPANSADDGVSEVRFADPLDGWVFGPDLWSTHDGGSTWSKSTLAGVWTLEAADDRVYAMARDISIGYDVIESSDPGSDIWTPTVSMTIGAGPVPSSELVLQRTAGWAVEVDRTVVGGARLTSGHWASWPAPCANNGGEAVVGASTPSSLVAICEEGIWGPSGYPGPLAVRAYFSGNAGATFFLGGIVPGDANASGSVVASPMPGAAVTNSLVGTEDRLVETLNDGASWQVVATTSDDMQFAYLGFTSASQGVAIETGQDPSRMLMTFNGGRSWSPVTF